MMCCVVLYLEAMLREVVDLLVLQAVHEELEHHDCGKYLTFILIFHKKKSNILNSNI